MSDSRQAHLLREYIQATLEEEHDVTEWFDQRTHAIGGRFGDFLITENASTGASGIYQIEDGGLIGTYHDYAAARREIRAMEAAR